MGRKKNRQYPTSQEEARVLLEKMYPARWQVLMTCATYGRAIGRDLGLFEKVWLAVARYQEALSSFLNVPVETIPEEAVEYLEDCFRQTPSEWTLFRVLSKLPSTTFAIRSTLKYQGAWINECRQIREQCDAVLTQTEGRRDLAAYFMAAAAIHGSRSLPKIDLEPLDFMLLEIAIGAAPPIPFDASDLAKRSAAEKEYGKRLNAWQKMPSPQLGALADLLEKPTAIPKSEPEPLKVGSSLWG